MQGNIIGVPITAPPVCYISGGGNVANALRSTGQLWSWGQNSSGNLGINDGVIACVVKPFQVSGANRVYCYVDQSGGGATYTLDNTGMVWSWGANTNGNLGTNNTSSVSTPVSLAGAKKTFCKINGYGGGCYAIDKYGRLWAWGSNSAGQLGQNNITAYSTPVSVLGAVKTFCEISGGNNYTLAIDKYGKIWGWGNNTNGVLGINSSIGSYSTPRSICGATKTFCKVCGAKDQTFVLGLDKYGRAWGWGPNGLGAIGNNSNITALTPVSVCGAVKTFCQITAGNVTSMAIDKNGQIWTWGGNSNYLLGLNNYSTAVCVCTPYSISGAKKTFCKVVNNGAIAIALDYRQHVWTWGVNLFGALGFNRSALISTPNRVSGAKKTFCQIAGFNSAGFVAIDLTGRAWSWGTCTQGQLGLNIAATSICTPVSVCGAVKTFCKIKGMQNYIVALDKYGRAWGWGDNALGQLGNNSTTAYSTPVSVCGAVKTFCDIQNGDTIRFTAAIDQYGQVWTWGAGTTGALGDNTTVCKSTPVSIAGAKKTFCKIAVGAASVTAIDKYGQGWSWGSFSSGQLGNNSGTNFCTPVSVCGAKKTFCQITALSQSRFAIDQYGQAWVWGANLAGQLGTNDTASYSTPVSICGAKKTFCKIAAGVSVASAIDKYGRMWAWGLNSSGQLGNNSTTAYSTPVSVCGAVKTFCFIAQFGAFVTAIDKYGQAWSWGSNTALQLGQNYAAYYATPVRVCYF